MGPQAADLLGFPVEDWYELPFWEGRIHPDDRSGAVSKCRELSAAGGSFELEYRMVRSDESVIWVSDVVTVEMGDAGPVTLRGFLVDITAQKKLSRALEASEERLRRVLQEAPNALIFVRGDGTIVNANRLAHEMFGYTGEELIGSMVERLVPERFAGNHPHHRASFGGDPHIRPMSQKLDLWARRRDGSEFPVEISLSSIEVDGVPHVLAGIKDLTERKRIESELSERALVLRQIADALPAMIAVIDKNRRYRYVNDNYSQWIGLRQAQVVGRSVQEVLGEELDEQVRPRSEAALRGEEVQYQINLPWADGSSRPTEVSLVPRTDDEGAVAGYFVILFDISERVRVQRADRLHREALAHVSRVATMGELAASMAHELNQPLAAVVANAQAASRFLAMAPPDLGEVGEALTEISADGKRGADVIRRMRDLLRRGERREEVVDVESLVMETVEMLRSDAIARDVAMRVNSPGDLPHVCGDPIQLQQVILNVAMNAFDAVSGRDDDRGVLAIELSSLDGHVEMSFADNGPGLPDDLEGRVFAPFVSTKPEGLGMGLSISRTIIEAQGGKLLAGNNSGGGATLRILLPAHR